jgi:hypothetical protein
MSAVDAWRMVRKRGQGSGDCEQDWKSVFQGDRDHQLPAEWGKIETAQQMAGHVSSRTTGLYDRRNNELSLDEIEWISI